jgi:hypothetical protein
MSELTLPVPVPQHDRLGQGTAVEMSRAVAEVHAAMYTARQFPRDVTTAIAEMENSCRQPYMADRAFFRITKGGTPVTGPSVHLARELARCWGHIQYGIVEMRRDDDTAQSEMQAFAWDVQTGARLVHTFIVPHKRDKRDRKSGKATPEALISLQDIYENNANAGARRLRECVFGVMPPWFTERAKELCKETLDAGDGTPLPTRIDNCVTNFKALGVNDKQLEQKLGLPRIRWTGQELGLLASVYRSLKQGETTREEEFPPALVTAAEITAVPPPAATKPAKATKPAPTDKDDAGPTQEDIAEHVAAMRAEDGEPDAS